MSTVTVRIGEDAHRSLKELAQQTGEAMVEILGKAIEEYRRQQFLRGLAADFAALRSDPKAWGEELREREEWDATLGDDLEED